MGTEVYVSQLKDTGQTYQGFGGDTWAQACTQFISRTFDKKAVVGTPIHVGNCNPYNGGELFKLTLK